jgi:hypothetical protein
MPRTKASGSRYALLRDLDSPALYPFGVLLERPDGGGKLLTYGRPPGAIGLRQDYDEFDAALSSLSRGFLVTAVGREGEDRPE